MKSHLIIRYRFINLKRSNSSDKNKRGVSCSSLSFSQSVSLSHIVTLFSLCLVRIFTFTERERERDEQQTSKRSRRSNGQSHNRSRRSLPHSGHVFSHKPRWQNLQTAKRIRSRSQSPRFRSSRCNFSLFSSTPISIPCLLSMLQHVSCIVPCLVAEEIEDKWGGRNVVTVQMLLFCFENWKT